MDAKEFGKAYSREPHYQHDPNPERVEQMRGFREWSETFGEAMFDYLEENEDSRILDKFESTSIRYKTWFGQNYKAGLELAKNNIGDEDQVHVKDIDFHQLNAPMLQMWEPIIKQQPSVNVNEVHRAQMNLAMMGLIHLQERQGIVQENGGLPRSGELLQRYSGNIGASNEIDTAIVLLELSKRRPNIVTVPAPSQFEHSKVGSVNADFLVVDLENKQVRGIQTKSSSKALYRAAKYDPDYITTVNGQEDLFNQIAIRPDAKKSAMISTPWPGLIAIHSLVNQVRHRNKSPRKPTPSKISAQEASHLINARFQARSLAGDTKPKNKEAAAIIESRVMEDLYLQKRVNLEKVAPIEQAEPVVVADPVHPDGPHTAA